MVEVGLVYVVEVVLVYVVVVGMVGVERGEAVVVRAEVGRDVVVVEVEHVGVAVGVAWVEAGHDGEEGVELVAGEHDAEEVGAEQAVGVGVAEGVVAVLDRKGLVAALGEKGLEEHMCLEEGRRGRGSRGQEG